MPDLSPAALNPRLADYDALRMKLVRGDLVSRNFQAGECNTDDSVGSTASFVTGVRNRDGTNAGLNVTVPAGTNGFRLQQSFTGRAFGIRFRRNNAVPEFTVRIDGVAYRVDPTLLRDSIYGYTIEDDLCCLLITDDLPEGDHLAEITLVAPASGSNAILLYGFLVEKRAGYSPSAPADCLIVSGTNTPTVSTNIYDATTSSGGAGNARRISRVHYHNASGSPVVVTIKYNAIFYEELTIAANSSADVSFSPPIQMNSLWTHSSPGGGANLPFFVFGSF